MTTKTNQGLQEHQTSKEVESQLKILNVLAYDEDWHRYSELQSQTKLSTKTLTKQLDKLEEIKLIEKDKINYEKYSYAHPILEIKEYPHPVYYRLNPIFVNAFRGYRQENIAEKIKVIKSELLENKNPIDIIQEINKENNLTFLGILLFLKENRNIDDKTKRIILEYLVWSRYKTLTWKLIEETEKIIDSIDIKKLVWDA